MWRHTPGKPIRYGKIYPTTLSYCALLIVLAFLFDSPSHILTGLQQIILKEDSLITDYVALVGVGAAFFNSALVLLATLFILWLVKDPLNGYTIITLGLMGGFSLFGKNIFNIWPIILGTFLYAHFRREPFVKYSNVALLSTSLSPVVSYVCFSGDGSGFFYGILLGICIGFILPSLSAYTYRIQNGMNLYNMGFACGLVAMMLVPVMDSMGKAPTTAHYWATGYNLPLGIFIVSLCVIFIVAGFFFAGRPPWAAWAGYRLLLHSTGRAPNDFLRIYGAAPVLINMGINGLIGTLYILAIGGDLNGPTLGGIFTIIGFSAYGKHCRNITPVILGVIIGGITMQWSLDDSAVQLAGLFCTTLAPISGYFGWPFGILAGFLHSSVVLHAGTPVEGINLYNNGYSGGLIAIVLYPTIMAIVRHNRPVLQDEDYFDSFEHNDPISPSCPTHKEP